MLNNNELERYKRQIAIPGLGISGQLNLKKTCILIVGAGGLGSPAALYLAAAGIGCLRIADSDNVDLSNLSRQILHFTTDLGRAKTQSAADKLRSINPEVKLEFIHERINETNLEKIFIGIDGIIDATDNIATRYVLNKGALKAKVPLFHGAVSGFEGRALSILPYRSACLMCLYQGVDIDAKPPVIGVTAGVIGCIQATEAIKYVTGIGDLLTDKLLIYDGLSMTFQKICVSRDNSCPHCGKMQ